MKSRRQRFHWRSASRWEKVGYLCFVGWVVGAIIVFFINIHGRNEFLDKTHQIEIGMSLQEAIAILGEPTNRQESKEVHLRHNERPRYAKLGKEHSLVEITWDGTGYIFRAFIVNNEIIATRNQRKGVKR